MDSLNRSICALVVLTMLVVAPRHARAASASDAPAAALAAQPGPLEATRRAEAVRAGVEWMIANVDEMPEGWVYAYLLRLHRLLADDGLAVRIEALLRQDAKSGRHTSIPEDLHASVQLAPARLLPILFELLRRRQLGLPYEEAAAVIERQIGQNERRFWAPLRATQRVVYVYLFSELGIRTSLDLEAIIATLQRSAETLPAEQLVASRHYIYGLTHLILARSHYFRGRPEPVELGFTIPLLRGTLERQLAAGSDDEALDLQGEVLACLQLMGVSDDAVMQATRAQLIGRQNSDGSWGMRPGAGRSKLHVTFNAIAALSEIPDPPRVDGGW